MSFRSSRDLDLFGDRSYDRVCSNPFAFRGMTDMLNEMDQDFDRIPPQFQFDAMAQLAVFQSDIQYIVKVDTPGMSRDNIKLEIQGEFLEIVGKIKNDTSGFKRSIKLPKDVNKENIVVKYDNGVFELIMPRLS